MVNRSYAILGTGAIGGYYGARLQQAGCEVHFLLRSDYEWVKSQGLKVESVRGDVVLPQVKAYHDPAQMPPCDVVVIALKSTQNHLLPSWLPLLLKPQSSVLLLQNGLGFEAEIAAVVGDRPVIGGLCFICANKVGPGQVRHLDYEAIALAEYRADGTPAGITAAMRAIAQDFEQAGVEIRLRDDLVQTRWEKLAWNIPFNGLSVILNATTAEMMASAAIRELATELMTEVAAGTASYGRPFSPKFIPQMLAHTAQMRPYLTSMKLDYDARRPLEVEGIFGAPLQAAAARGVSLPRIETLYRQLQFLDGQNRGLGLTT